MQQNGSPKKTSVLSAVIASACILVYLAALISACIRIYISVDQRRFAAEQDFFDVADLAASAGVLGFMDEPFIEAIKDALASSGTLEAVIITGPDNAYAFEREQGKWINRVNDAPRFKNRFDMLRQPLYQPLRIQGLRNVNIEARAGAFDYGMIANILKETLLLVLAGLVLAFFTLLLESLLGKNGEPPRDAQTAGSRARRETNQPNPSAANEKQHGEYKPVDDSFFEVKDQTPAPLIHPAPQAIAAAPLTGSVPFAGPVQAQAAEPAPDSFEAFLQAREGIKTETDYPENPAGREEIKEETDPPEAGCTARLESELRRCASDEQDLAFIVMGFKDPVDGAFFSRFAEDAVQFFTMRDLIFERGRQGISVIYPNIDIDGSIARTEEFRLRTLGNADAFKTTADLRAGISSRAGRLVEAERLMFEAGKAFDRALADPVSPIIAFKSDPEKYRAFIAGHR